MVGVSASGKSTLAARLAERLGVPFVELDALHWEAGWVEAREDVLRERTKMATAGAGWVVAGNYAALRDLTWDRADTLVWLDYSLPRLFWQLTWRIVRRCLLGEVLWNGNREPLTRHLFTRDSLYVWVLQSYREVRGRYRSMIETGDPPGARWVRLRNPRETRAWLARVGISRSCGGTRP